MFRSRRDADTVVVYFGAAPPPAGDESVLRPIGKPRLDRVRWYCEWTRERRRRVLVVVPAMYRPDAKEVQEALAPFPVLWCGERFPPERLGRNVLWLINGDQMPIIDWSQASAAVRREAVDVQVFGQPLHSLKGNYPESVVVDADGHVLRFQRHYFDSQTCGGRFGGRASFMAVRGEHAAAVIEHICSRGWGMDSLGALTVRLQVRWAPNSCLISGSLASQYSLVAAESTAPVARGPHDETQHTGDNGQTHCDGPSRRLRPIGGGDLPGVADDHDLNLAEDSAYAAAKRVVDVTSAALGLLLLSPLLLLIALFIKVTSKGPILFGHKRQGLAGREFRCWKFRSMRSDADQMQAALRSKNEVDGPQFKITDDPRITPLGAILRSTNLDELPQLINVLLGEMSLVGPRPSPDAENQYCPAWRKARLSVRPGMTGLWQVFRNRGESASDFQEWIYYDTQYARHRCMGLDVFILLCTPVAIVAPGWTRWLRQSLEKRGICCHAREMCSGPSSVAGYAYSVAPAAVSAGRGEVNGKNYDSAAWNHS